MKFDRLLLERDSKIKNNKNIDVRNTNSYPPSNKTAFKLVIYTYHTHSTHAQWSRAPLEKVIPIHWARHVCFVFRKCSDQNLSIWKEKEVK